MPDSEKTVFIFRRDLRLEDNTGLISACKSSSQVIPCYIFEPNIMKNKYNKKNFRLRFLFDSIEDLQSQIQGVNANLHIFFNHPTKILSKLKKEYDIKSVFVNRDYSVYSKKRDEEIKRFCKKNEIVFRSLEDQTLVNFEEIQTLQGTPYLIFSQFLKKAKMSTIRRPQKFAYKNLMGKKIADEISIKEIIQKFPVKDCLINGGTSEAKKILLELSKFKNYQEERNFPHKDATTHLSPHNKFGTCSIRRVYHEIVKQLGKNHTLIDELFWRDFFTSIMFHYPYSYSSAFRKKYSKFPWSKNKKFFEKWRDGLTGFPIVDAGMRELNSTGYMHNRVRMIVASFLTKDMHIDWKWGERYFAEKLIDYDPCVNVGNWQWAASTGCDSQPWFRIFNPWLQQKKFDKDCIYIRKWIKELSECTNNQIHNWFKMKKSNCEYPLPILDHQVESLLTKELFSKHSKDEIISTRVKS